MDKIINELGLYLTFAKLRHRIIAGNIANAETPYYRAFDLVFRKVFEESASPKWVDMRITNSRHIRAVSLFRPAPELVSAPVLTVGQDQNRVDLEYQMAQLAENTMNYQIVSQLLAKRFEEIKVAIEGR
jgi:flagellar basal-body rod protein FlgB